MIVLCYFWTLSFSSFWKKRATQSTIIIRNSSIVFHWRKRANEEFGFSSLMWFTQVRSTYFLVTEQQSSTLMRFKGYNEPFSAFAESSCLSYLCLIVFLHVQASKFTEEESKRFQTPVRWRHPRKQGNTLTRYWEEIAI